MRRNRTIAILLLLCALSLPAVARPTREDPPREPGGVVGRVIHLIKLLIRPLDDSDLLSPPRP